MLFLKYLLMWGGIGMMAVAAGILIHDFWLELRYRQAQAEAGPEPLPPVPQVRWRTTLALALLAWGRSFWRWASSWCPAAWRGFA